MKVNKSIESDARGSFKQPRGLGALERPAQEPQSGALVRVQLASSIAVEHFPTANTSLEMPSASLVSRGREVGTGSQKVTIS